MTDKQLTDKQLMGRILRRLAVLVLLPLSTSVIAQTHGDTAGQPTFEVASIKRNSAVDARGSLGPQPGGRFVMVNGTAQSLVTLAFNVAFDDLVVGAPSWVRTERYDLNAKAPTGTATFEQMRMMLRALLRDRFKLISHDEMQPQLTYALVPAQPDSRLGPQLRQAQVDCDARRAAIAAGTAPPLTPPPGTGPATPCTIRSRADSLNSGGTSMTTLARILTGLVGRVVVDKTGLSGDYQFELQFAPTGNGFSVPSTTEPSQFASIFTALEEQLGLKLSSERAPVQVLVVDHIEPPTAD